MKASLNILYVDDDPDSVEFMRFVLEAEGHTVITTLAAEEAIEHLQQQEFDLYILDLQMPGVDGLDLCRKIRSRNSRVPIIIYSAAVYLKDKDAGYDAGATSYLVKPDGLDQIMLIANGLRLVDKASMSQTQK